MYSTTSSPRQDHKKNLASICHAITDPRSRKSGYGLLLGCRSPLDGGHEIFFYAFPPKKTVKSSSDGRARHRYRSGVVNLVWREPLIIARVENGVTEFSPKRQKTPKNKKKIGSGTTIFSGELQARLAKNGFFFGHLFLNITNVFCAKKRVGHAFIYAQDGHWLASFEVIPPPQKLVFPRPKNLKWKFPTENCFPDPLSRTDYHSPHLCRYCMQLPWGTVVVALLPLPLYA